MNETNDTDEQVGGRKKTLSLRRGGVEKGTVRQSFSHGRSKSVVVEKKKRRVVTPGQGEQAGSGQQQPSSEAPKAPAEGRRDAGAAKPASAKSPSAPKDDAARARTDTAPAPKAKSATSEGVKAPEAKAPTAKSPAATSAEPSTPTARTSPDKAASPTPASSKTLRKDASPATAPSDTASDREVGAVTGATEDATARKDDEASAPASSGPGADIGSQDSTRDAAADASTPPGEHAEDPQAEGDASSKVQAAGDETASTGTEGSASADELAQRALKLDRRPKVLGKAEVRREAPRQQAPSGEGTPQRKRSVHASSPGPRSERTARGTSAERPGSRERTAEKAPTERQARTDRTGRTERQERSGQRQPQGRGQVHRTLSKAEQDARARALATARTHETEHRQKAQEEAEREREAIDRAKRELAEAELRREREEARRKAEEDLAARKASEKTRATSEKPSAAAEQPQSPEDTRTAARPGATSTRRKSAKEQEEEEAATARAKKARATPAKPAPKGDDRRRTKLTITTALEDDSERGRSLAALKRRREKEKRGSRTGPREKVMREVTIPDAISIQDLAARMSERGVDVIKFLMKQGQMHKITDVIDADTADLVVTEFGHTVKRVSEGDVEEGLFEERDVDLENAVSRPPVVTIMGHVDHGKTSLLDAVRSANVVSGEAGGITQHIGAYQVELEGQKVTFLDTPGHAAFTAMRSRGAKATDMVILVVAADDGVMPQTAEAISHAKAAGVPIIVAINKIDKPDADPSRVRTDLLQHDMVVESLSGDVQEVEVSALQRLGLDELLQACLLQAEILELKANPDRDAQGVVVEAQLDKGRGPVATCLMQQGTLSVGDILVAGTTWGKVRALVTDKGERVKSAGPSTPVEVLGLSGTPDAGDNFAVVESEQRARDIVEYRERVKKETTAAPSTSMSLEQMMSNLQTQGTSEFPMVLKGDVQGSVEAIVGALDKMSTDEVAARILHQGVGAITESDVTLAAATGGVIIGFNVRANKQAREAAERAGVEIRYYSIIYNLIDDVKDAMSGMLRPEVRETFIGYAEILQVFNITKVGKVAGCRVTDGMVERGAGVRLLRDNVVIHEGKLSTLKRFKDEVREVPMGQECGMAFEKYEDIREGDIIECFRVEQVERTLA